MKSVPEISITKPYFTEDEERAVREVLASGWVSQGPRVAAFEEAFASYVGARYAVATSSCTSALHLVLAALGIRPSDEVLVPAFTYVATANVVEYQHARPVFVDIDRRTFNVDASKLEEKITKRTKAILPVHLFGLAADMDPILEIARRHDLAVIEDAACGVGALYKGRHVGTFGTAGCFSFHPRKVFTTGEGGMIVTNDHTLAGRFQMLRSHGATASDWDRHRGQGFLLPAFEELGYNYRMTDLQAAIGTAQLKKVKWILERRRQLAEAYTASFQAMPGLSSPHEPDGCLHAYQAYVVLVQSELRDLLVTHLQKAGIATRPGTHAVHALGYYRHKYGFREEDCPSAWKAERGSVTLPLYPQMVDEEQKRVIESVEEAVTK